MKPKLKAPGTKRLKLSYDGPPSNLAFKFNLRRYSEGFKDLHGTIIYDPRFDTTDGTTTPDYVVEAVRAASPGTIRAMTPLTVGRCKLKLPFCFILSKRSSLTIKI